MNLTIITTVLAVAAMLSAAAGFAASLSGNDHRSVGLWALAFILKTIETMIIRSQLKRQAGPSQRTEG